MNFTLTDDQRRLQRSARDLARAELPAIAAMRERDNTLVPAALLSQYAELGFLGINDPEHLGGRILAIRRP